MKPHRAYFVFPTSSNFLPRRRILPACPERNSSSSVLSSSVGRIFSERYCKNRRSLSRFAWSRATSRHSDRPSFFAYAHLPSFPPKRKHLTNWRNKFRGVFFARVENARPIVVRDRFNRRNYHSLSLIPNTISILWRSLSRSGMRYSILFFAFPLKNVSVQSNFHLLQIWNK